LDRDQAIHASILPKLRAMMRALPATMLAVVVAHLLIADDRGLDGRQVSARGALVGPSLEPAP
jgi:hypothetical protein